MTTYPTLPAGLATAADEMLDTVCRFFTDANGPLGRLNAEYGEAIESDEDHLAAIRQAGIVAVEHRIAFARALLEHLERTGPLEIPEHLLEDPYLDALAAQLTAFVENEG